VDRLILGIGVDMVELQRIRNVLERHGQSFLDRILAPAEQQLIDPKHVESKRIIEFVGGRFAAKEAVAKALGTGIGYIAWTDIEILRTPEGMPVIKLKGRAWELEQARGIVRWHVSISHTHTHGIAFVVAES
jgi:holo-[acyl-carrier protein] synthase